jgi:hypothetical protein
LPHPDAQQLLIVAVILAGWFALSLLVLAACRTAARSDAEAVTPDRDFSSSQPRLLLISQTPSGEHVANGSQEDLHVGPKRPVGDVQIVDRSHLA